MKLLVVLLFVFSFEVQAKKCKDNFESSEKQVNLMELYTSEGCSSCPPAESWLNGQLNNSNLYKSFIPMAFHVTYWDYLGHKDQLAFKAYSNRQRRYASEWKDGRVYTPGFVVNGLEWKAAGRSAPNELGPKVGVLKVKKLSKDQWEVEFDQKGTFILNGALLIHGVEHKIRRGENSGKTLKHNFVVSDLKQTVLVGKAKIKLAPRHKNFNSKSIVFWVNKARFLKPIQATGNCLN